MARFTSVFTALFVLFMALMVIATPVPVESAESPVAEVAARAVEDSGELHVLEKRKTGKATWFNTGLGNCGKVSKDSQLVVALATKTYAGGKFCGKTITIKNTKNGKTTTAKVMDSCPGCGAGDLDLSPAAFKKLGALSTGVLSVSWNFN
ncbi:barwin-like endoglucanase [Ceratobasidium sp. AG-I]|nr:barwin-like endoglucanase [Ceratobasidium sp. AG-I]